MLLFMWGKHENEADWAHDSDWTKTDYSQGQNSVIFNHLKGRRIE